MLSTLALCSSVMAVEYDINGDGKADILWRDGNVNHLWKMSTTGSHAYKNIGTKSSTYGIAGIADFNGDGVSDILWRRDSGNYLWYMNADGTHSYKNIGTKSTSYRIVGTADFNGDGIADILWRKGDYNYLWYMHADGTHSYKKINSTYYNIVGIGDFDGDSIADILLRKDNKNYIWYMNADGSRTYKNIGTKSNTYNVAGVADFNGDGKADILWRRDSGNYLWYMNADGSHAYKNIGTKSTAYEVAGIADYNGDGKADIFWKRDNGNYLWYMNTDGSHAYKNIGTKAAKYKIASFNKNRPIPFTFPGNYYTDIELDYDWNDGQQTIRFEAEKFILNSDKTLSFQELVLQDGVFIDDDDDDEPEYILENGQWVLESDESTMSGVTSQNNAVWVLDALHQLTIKSIKNIVGKSVAIEGSDESVSMPSGAIETTMIHEVLADVYGIDERTRTYGATENEYFVSLREVLKHKCGNYWFTDAKEDSGVQGIAFTCGQEAQSSGTLVGVKEDGSLVANVGTWERTQLEGSSVEGIVMTISTTYNDDSDTPLFAIKDGEVWRGWHDIAGAKGEFKLYNQPALDAVEAKMAQMAEEIQSAFEALIVGQTKYFVNSRGGIGYRSYANNGTYVGSFTQDGTTYDTSGTYTSVDTTLTINRTSPSDVTLVLDYTGEEAGGLGFNISINGGEVFQTISFGSASERDAFTAGY